MKHVIEYESKSHYRSLSAGITIEATLRCNSLAICCEAKVDTGAAVCLFERNIADALGIEVETGYREQFSTLAGNLVGYAHPIELETAGLRFQTYVYFAESYSVRRNLLGRQGWLQLLQLGLDDYRSELYLKAN